MFIRPYSVYNMRSVLRDIKRVRNLQKIVVNQYSTIDVAEISNFKNYAEEWWDETGKFKSLHSMNSIRVPFIRDGLANAGKISNDILEGPKPLENLKILDIGCGGGILSEALARLGANVTGIDACKELIDCASLHARTNEEIKDNITYIHETAEDHSKELNLNKYDAVVASEIIEHVTSQNLFLECCSKMAKPGGSIFVTTLNKTTCSWLAAIVLAENVVGMLPKGTHDWEKFIPPHEVQKFLEECNCRTKCIHGMTVNVLTNTWHWFPDKSINYALHAVKNT